MKTLLFALAIIFLTGTALAGQQYNPYTGRHETVPDNYKLQYNPYSGQTHYQHPGADLEYNPYSGRHEYCPPDEPEPQMHGIPRIHGIPRSHGIPY